MGALTEAGKAVFLSCASQDAIAAERVCAALRAAGIEVWFDKSELRGGDAWDVAIRQQIKACTLFVPVISRSTQALGEGYFRLEWKLAVDRSHLMAADQAFLLPIVIDETPDAGARVPDRFREVQWTRLPGGETPPAFAERVARLLSFEPAETAPAAPRGSTQTTPKLAPASSRSKAAAVATIAVFVLALAYLVANRWLSHHGATAPVSAFNPPPHSIAVLPFANMSADKDQEYFSDGLTLGDVAAKVELGGSSNPAAFDAYLRGAKAGSSARNTKDLPAAIVAYTEAIRVDPHYALAFAARSLAFTNIAAEAETAAAIRESYDKAEEDARRSLELAPDLAQAHLALAYVAEETLNFPQASIGYERALSLAPGNAQVLRLSGTFAALMGRFDAGVEAIRRAVVLDPLARSTHATLGLALYYARRHDEALEAYAEVLMLDPDYNASYADRGLSYYGFGDLEHARSACEVKPDFWESRLCLALVYHKMERQADAEAELSKLEVGTG